jgi:hypothetical protein
MPGGRNCLAFASGNDDQMVMNFTMVVRVNHTPSITPALLARPEAD